MGATAAAAVTGTPDAGAAAQVARPVLAEKVTPDHYVPFGRTGMRVSPVGAGLSLKAADLVASADAGINYFDTAEKYLDGKHTTMVGEALKGRDRSKIFVNAKFQDGLQWGLTATADAIVARVHKALERLGTAYIDSMMIHNVQRREAVTNPEWLRAFERLKSDGKVRFSGRPRTTPSSRRLWEPSSSPDATTCCWSRSTRQTAATCTERPAGLPLPGYSRPPMRRASAWRP